VDLQGCPAAHRPYRGVLRLIMAPVALWDPVGNLPAELTSFIGRRRELAEARAALSVTRLLTLTGMGGVGKTRLARRLAADVHRTYANGVWQVELGDLQEPALLLQTVATSLGLLGPPGPWAINVLTDYLTDKHMLLLLDNCEHLIDACAITVHALLTACPGLQIIATSREPLSVSGERTYPVPPLSFPDVELMNYQDALPTYESVSLFVDRGAAVLPGFSLNDSNRLSIVQLCNRLDGVPLAVELAALRLRALSPGQILTQLEDRYLLGLRGSRSASPRQQTLGALVDWSYDLCSDEERLVWRLVSVFSRGFELDAAEAICAGSALAERAIVNIVISLVEKSILIREERADVIRYRMPQIIRDYALSRLRESTDEKEAMGRHRDWYAALVARAYEEYVGPAQLSWFRRLRQEHSNIRAALEFSLAESGEASQAIDIVLGVTDYWAAFGFLSEGRHWIDQALRRTPSPSPVRAKALDAATLLAARQGDQAAAEDFLTERRALACPRNGAEFAWFDYAGAMVAMYGGRLQTATQLFEEAHSRFQNNEDTHGLVATLSGLVLVAALSADSDVAVRLADEFMSLAQPRGERWVTSYVLWSLGLAKWRIGDIQHAADLHVESLTVLEPFDDKRGFGLRVEALAWISAMRGRYENAAQLLGAARHSFASIGSSVLAFSFMVNDHERCESSVRASLGDAMFEAAIERGAKLSFGQTIALVTGRKQIRVADQQPAGEDVAALLTGREREIADLIAQGLTNKEIAASLIIAPRTAEGHVEHILLKLGFSSRAQVAAWVAERRAMGDKT
jgi:predicted ATPase/DNA-binding CsgD family transcriptional regulator